MIITEEKIVNKFVGIVEFLRYNVMMGTQFQEMVVLPFAKKNAAFTVSTDQPHIALIVST